MFLKARLEGIRPSVERLNKKKILEVFPNAVSKLRSLEAIQGHVYGSKEVALVSLIHRSALVYWPENRRHEIQSNERLEFLGDALLGSFVAIEAMQAHGDLDEGELSRLRAAIVGTENLADKAQKLGLGKSLLLGKGEMSSGGQRRQSILADSFEAVTAAIFIDAGEEKAWSWLLEVFGSDLILAEKILSDFDAKTRFQQWTQRIIGVPPSYRVVGTQSTPERSDFIVAGFVGQFEIARAQGRNKREASKRVAVLMQEKVNEGVLTERVLKAMHNGTWSQGDVRA